MARIRLSTSGTTTTPPADEVSIYAKPDLNLYLKDALGNERQLLDTGTASPGYAVEQFTLSLQNILDEEVVLAETPSHADRVLVQVDGAAPCFYSLDFTVNGNAVSWSGLRLAGLLEAGDLLQVIYLV